MKLGGVTNQRQTVQPPSNQLGVKRVGKNYLYQKFFNLYPLAMELSYKFALKYLLFDR